jgi:GNAT superfamily N-acetyltransferase
MNDSTTIIPVGERDLPALVELAGVIWRACYPGIISPEQIEFMLAHMYDQATLREEIRSQGIRFYQLLAEASCGGFASIGPTDAPRVMKLHKLYLLPELHGRGLGSRMLTHCADEARRLGAQRLILAVNKRNARAIAAYRRNGFAVAEAVVTDIGGGFVMDDYLMARDL